MPQKTLADTLAARESVYVNCAHPVCCKSTKLDVQALIDRLGPDHGVNASGSRRAVRLLDCKAPDRDRRPVFFTEVPDYDGRSKSPPHRRHKSPRPGTVLICSADVPGKGRCQIAHVILPGSHRRTAPSASP